MDSRRCQESAGESTSGREHAAGAEQGQPRQDAAAAHRGGGAAERSRAVVATRSRVEVHYDLTSRILGSGVSGTVRAGTCRQTGRRVAIKSFAKAGAPEKRLAGMRSELEIHGSLVPHPGIVRLEAAYESDAELHLVMEELRGGEVFDRVLERGRLGEAEAADVAVQVLQILAHLHAQRVLHRDVKLENLIYTERGGRDVKLIDFGLAARLDSGEKLASCGTIQYTAPEVLAGRPVDEKSDLWSLGSVLFIMLTGRMVFAGTSEAVLVEKNKAGRVDWHRRFAELSMGAQALVRWLLRVDPGERPSTSAALAHPWLQAAVARRAGLARLSTPRVAELHQHPGPERGRKTAAMPSQVREASEAEEELLHNTLREPPAGCGQLRPGRPVFQHVADFCLNLSACHLGNLMVKWLLSEWCWVCLKSHSLLRFGLGSLMGSA